LFKRRSTSIVGAFNLLRWRCAAVTTAAGRVEQEFRKLIRMLRFDAEWFEGGPGKVGFVENEMTLAPQPIAAAST